MAIAANGRIFIGRGWRVRPIMSLVNSIDSRVNLFTLLSMVNSLVTHRSYQCATSHHCAAIVMVQLVRKFSYLLGFIE